MRVSRLRGVLLLTLASLLPGCANNPAPKTWRPPASLAQKSTRGGWIRVEPIVSGVPPADAFPVEGELIAIDEHAYHVLTASGLRSVSRSSTHRITVVAYGTSRGTVAAWAAVGGLSTLSHGAFLVFTAPMWAIAGGIVAVKESSAGLVYDPERARAFARFPQGLPPGLDPAELGPLVGNSAGGAVVPRR